MYFSLFFNFLLFNWSVQVLVTCTVIPRYPWGMGPWIPKSTGAQVSYLKWCRSVHAVSSLYQQTPNCGLKIWRADCTVLITVALCVLICGEADSHSLPFLSLPPPTSRIFLGLPACLFFHIDFQVSLSSSKKEKHSVCA